MATPLNNFPPHFGNVSIDQVLVLGLYISTVSTLDFSISPPITYNNPFNAITPI